MTEEEKRPTSSWGIKAESAAPAAPSKDRGKLILAGSLAAGAVLTVVIGVVIYKLSADRRLEKAKTAGADAALAFAAEHGGVLDEYLAFEESGDSGRWMVRKIDLAEVQTEDGPPIVNAAILYGSGGFNRLVAASSRGMKSIAGSVQPLDGKRYPGVSCLRGYLIEMGTVTPCLEFKVRLEVPGSESQGTARLIVRYQH